MLDDDTVGLVLSQELCWALFDIFVGAPAGSGGNFTAPKKAGGR
jgi:hypothetical protein